MGRRLPPMCLRSRARLGPPDNLSGEQIDTTAIPSMKRGSVSVGAMPTLLIFLLVFGVLVSGLLPLSMPFGFAAGGVLQTGQVEPFRWWLGTAGAVVAFALLAHFLRWHPRAWWLAVLIGGIAVAVGLFVGRASLDQPRGTVAPLPVASYMRVGIVSALPLFWPEGVAPAAQLSPGSTDRRGPLVEALGARAVDTIDPESLSRLDTLILAQPRLLQPVELVALDDWVRKGGRAIIFADPLLMWPSGLSVADPRRAPLTSLLDPLLTHWGLRLEPVEPGEQGVQRRMLSDGRVLLVAGASRFSRVPEVAGVASCTLAERGLMALCTVGRGSVRLIADADMLDDRLWLADARWPDRPEAQASDVVALLRGWGADPLRASVGTATRRVTDEAALFAAMRWAILGMTAWVGLGWLGYRRVFRGDRGAFGRGDEG